jgi:hypothetical protein
MLSGWITKHSFSQACGSGAMEAAHRSVIQSRMKRSGQRWSDRGAQNLLNLRVAYKSGKAKLIRQIITGIAA